MKVLVTGAGGFVGSYVVRDLLDRGHDVAILLRGEMPWRLDDIRSRVRIVRGDLAQRASYAAALAEFAPEAIAHLAWQGVANHARNDWRQAENVQHAVDLLEAAMQAGTRHFIGCGSQAEYGPRGERTDEDAPLRPTTAYGAAKVAAFYLLTTLAGLHGVRFAWARFFSTYGPGEDAHWMIPQLVGRLLRGERASLTEGRQVWDYCHVRDAAHAITRLVETPGARGPFNVGSGACLPVRRIAEMVRDAAAPGAELGFGEVAYRPDQVMHLEADIRRLTGATGWTPRVALEDGIAETVAWFRERGAPVAAR